jgi:6-pyruvoyltetrahydropterin/6-carboxytetrahydropterin synthase
VYSLSVRDHVMIAHSFQGEIFGPAQRLHGATYVIDATFSRQELDPDGLVVDIGLARQRLRAVLDDWDYRNLDEVDAFHGRNTTTEFLAREVFDRLVDEIRSGGLGDHGRGIERVAVTLKESHLAWATFEGDV